MTTPTIVTKPLASTGASVVLTAEVAVVLLATGAGLMFVARRRSA